MTKQLLILFSILSTWSNGFGQLSPNSLQSAVDALHRREAQLALNDNYDPSARYPSSLEDSQYLKNREVFDIDTPSTYRGNRQQLNKVLSSYLAREEEDRENTVFPPDYDEDDYRLEESKRSIFRERDEPPYQSVFREREVEDKPDITDDFLREIDHQRNLEREERYRETLRGLWEKYQQQENEIERELFDEEKKRSDIMTSQMYYPPIMAKKKSYYPILPWLPASRKKRFPVAKRSPKSDSNDPDVATTNEKVNKDLAVIFGENLGEKKKRSSDDNAYKKSDQPTSTTTTSQIKNEETRSTELDHEHLDEEHDEVEEHEPEHEEDEDEHDFDDSEEDNDKKKKRAVVKKKRSNLEVVKEDQIIPGDLTDFKKKKSIQWSKYFGINRRKKSDWLTNKYSGLVKKRTDNENSLHSFRNHEVLENKKKNVADDKLQNMDQKLKTIEDLIIDETVKYTGAHEGILSQNEIRKLKDHVVSRLATAYSLEKMRRALEKLKHSMDEEKHLQTNKIDDEQAVEKAKRVAIKKEKAEFENSNHKIESVTQKVLPEEPDNGLDNNGEEKVNKMKKSEFSILANDINDFEEELGAGHFIEPISEGYLAGKGAVESSNQCSLLDTIEKRCRGVDLLSGDLHQSLLPICGVHQLCYLCGTTQTACDFQYLSEADSICGPNSECQSIARSTLMILRGAPNSQLGPRECAKNSCLYNAMREIGL